MVHSSTTSTLYIACCVSLLLGIITCSSDDNVPIYSTDDAPDISVPIDTHDSQDSHTDELYRLIVAPTVISLGSFDHAQVFARVYDISGRLLQDTSVSWESSQPEIASVDESGRVEAHAPGETKIRAWFKNVSGEALVQVNALARLEILPENREIGVGETLSLEVRGFADNGTELAVDPTAVHWRAAPEDIAQIDENGRLSGHKAGWVEVRAKIGDIEARDNFRTEVKFNSLYCKYSLCCMNSTQSQLYCWGRTPGVPADASVPANFYFGALPKKVDTDLSFVSYDWDVHGTICGLRSNGEVYCWGIDVFKLVSDTIATYETPQKVETDLRFMQIALGTGAACGLSFDKDIYCWGIRPFYAYGTSEGTIDNAQSTPYLLAEGSFSKLRMAESTLCALDNKNDTWVCMGKGPLGWIGEDGSGELHLTPIDSPEPLVDLFPANPLGDATCGLSATNHVYCRGKNSSGALGHPADDDAIHETFLPPAWDIEMTRLNGQFYGQHYCGARASDNAIVCWGNNGGWYRQNAQQIPPSQMFNHQPIEVEGVPQDWADFSGNCLLTAGGDLWCWNLTDEGRGGTHSPAPGSGPDHPFTRRIHTF